MQPSRRCTVFEVNAFSRERNGGNPVGVVLDADGLSDEQMRTLANAHPAPDTVFVLKARADDHDGYLRFLTPRRETTFIGHATLASQYVLAKLNTAPGVPKRRLRLLTGIGIVEIEVLQAVGDYRIAITQSAPALGPLFGSQYLPAVLEALGLPADELHPDYPLQLVAERAPRLLIGVRGQHALSALKPNFESLKRLSSQVGAEGYFVFCFDGAASIPSTHSRLFCPALGIPEDPVSGNTHAMLGVYLIQHGVLQFHNGSACFRGHQGQWMGRPGIIDIELSGDAQSPTRVRIVGDAAITQEKSIAV